MPSVGTPNGMYNVLMTNGNSTPTSNGSSTNSVQTAFSPPGQAASSSVGEEISTIFVVGFPDDIQEREFQNMFLFCPGFEAATLKIPSKDQQQQQEDNNNNNDITNGGSGARKQIIGFAKFRTRLGALEAKDILSGRKVDAEKGSVLKAEMAKKNLHTKRTTSAEQQQQQQLSSQALPHHQQQPVQSTSYPLSSQHPLSSKRYSINTGTVNPSAYEAFHSVPPAMPADLHPPTDLSYPDYYSDPFSPGVAPLSPTYHEPPMFVPRGASFDTRSASMGDIFGSMVGMPSTSSSRLPSGFNPGHRFSTMSLTDVDNGLSDHANLFGSMYPGTPAQQQQQTGFSFASPPINALNSVPEEIYPLYLSSQQPPTMPTDLSFSETTTDHPSPLPSLSSRFVGLDINTPTPTTLTINGGLASPGLTSPTGFRSFSSVLGIAAPAASMNPADQNPPCNTLYVGNLPHNADEEELKTMFSKCPGYVRLSFRNKANGPMCFVEFEDVACATQTMHELYGNVLSNSVKGGIRLSFSKNPLGVRPPSMLDSRRDSKHQAFDQLQ